MSIYVPDAPLLIHTALILAVYKQAHSGKRVIALKALANKLSKACFFMLRDGKDFDVKRLVG